jgi:L-iditol 2-dehydrogenase
MNRLPAEYKSVYLLGPEAVEMRSLPLPQPGPGELLLRVDAATTCGTDVKVYRRGGHARIIKVPAPFGHEVAGTVVALGKEVDRWSLGDRVIALNSASCGDCDYCQVDRENLCRDLHYLNGAFSEYLLIPRRFQSKSLYRIPIGLQSQLAALTEPLACVLHGIVRSNLTTPSDIVVFGAGPIGLLFVSSLVAKNHRVVLADPNPVRLKVGEKMGATSTLEVRRSDEIPARVREAAIDLRGFDLAIDTTGSVAAWELSLEVVRPGGAVNLFGGCAPGTQLCLDTENVHYNELAIIGSYHHRPAVVGAALDLISSGNLPIDLLISAEMNLDQTEDALRSMMRKEALKVAIRPVESSSKSVPN